MARRIDTRDRLLAAGIRLFADQGYEATSVGQIEEAVGLVPRRGTLYKHFASKEALLRAAIDDRVARAEAFLSLAEEVYAQDLTPALVREFGRAFLAEVDRHRDLTRIVEHEGERFPELRDAIRRQVIAPGYRAVTRTLSRLAPPGTDAQAHAAVLLAALTGLRRTAWTFGASTYRVADGRALDAWAAQALAVLQPRPSVSAAGYRSVDADPVEAVALLDAMDATGAWPATIELRAWERVRLRLRPGERLLDVGCGLGDAGLALAADLGPHGELVGIDASETMVEAARARAVAGAHTVAAPTRFVVGDAERLDLPDGAFDAARAERTLQWVDDAQRAVAELVRVLRPGGRLSLIDSDWSTLHLDVGDPAVERVVTDALRVERNRPSNVGARLGALAEAAGGTVVATHTTTHHWTDWDPDTAPAPPGCFSMRSLADDLVSAGRLDPDRSDAFVEQVHAAARAGTFRLALTLHAVVATTATATTPPPTTRAGRRPGSRGTGAPRSASSRPGRTGPRP